MDSLIIQMDNSRVWRKPSETGHVTSLLLSCLSPSPPLLPLLVFAHHVPRPFPCLPHVLSTLTFNNPPDPTRCLHLATAGKDPGLSLQIIRRCKLYVIKRIRRFHIICHPLSFTPIPLSISNDIVNVNVNKDGDEKSLSQSDDDDDNDIG